LFAKLRRAKLLAGEDPQNRGHLDTHPLVREYFGEQLRTQRTNAWKECNKRLYNYYRTELLLSLCRAHRKSWSHSYWQNEQPELWISRDHRQLSIRPYPQPIQFSQKPGWLFRRQCCCGRRWHGAFSRRSRRGWLHSHTSFLV
jgi:hypothetical protein